ncbi:hypothetical protein F5148DRAFT_1180153 [Russula earlei]|uniref:Uncharacterized protein n=1 Tax=Russula earlei TaxID=71964 RepID=A0ACC0UH12_9AGAM|nr:hypothetical protein F5148DRAFT_1180153 [Russula earlei]
MSQHAIAPEVLAAWRHLELDNELRTYEGDCEAESRLTRELDIMDDVVEKSKTLVNVLNFCKLTYGLKCFRQQLRARTLERYRCQSICAADLEARPGAYTTFGTEEDVRQLAKEMRPQDDKVAQMMAEFKEGQHHEANDERILAGLNDIIARRRAELQISELDGDEIELDDDEIELDGDESESDDDEREPDGDESESDSDMVQE